MADRKIDGFVAPGDVKPNIGSKPMIIGHKIMTGDPMMRENTEQDQAQPAPAPTPATPETTADIKPPSEKQRVVEPTTVPKSEDNPPNLASFQAHAAETKKSSDEPKPETSIDPAAQAMERQDRLEKILESKEYVVSIKQSRNIPRKQLTIGFVTLLVFGLGLLSFMVDTGRLSLGFEMPFTILGEKKAQPEQIETKNDSTIAADPSEQPDVQAENSATEENLADDIIAYSNEAFGVRFDYPAVWGEVTLEQINGYSDQSYQSEISFFLNVAFAEQPGLEIRIMNGRAFEGGRGFESPISEPIMFDEFYHNFAFSYTAVDGGNQIIRPDNNNPAEDLAYALTDVFTVTDVDQVLTAESSYTLEKLGLLPWTDEQLSEADAQSKLNELNQKTYFVRNYSSEKIIGVNASYTWTDGQKDSAMIDAFITAIRSIQ